MKALLIKAQLYGMLLTIMAVLASRQYQYTHSELYGCLKLATLLNIAHTMVKIPKLNGKTRRSFRLNSRWVVRKRGKGIERMRTSLVKLKTRFMMRWCSAVVHCVLSVGVCQ